MAIDRLREFRGEEVYSFWLDKCLILCPKSINDYITLYCFNCHALVANIGENSFTYRFGNTYNIKDVCSREMLYTE